MKKSHKTLLVSLGISIALVPFISFGFSYALWAVTDNANEFNLNIRPYAPGQKTVNYYLPNQAGTDFVLYSSETVDEGGTLANVPTPGAITNYTFEKWSTSSDLSDTFNTSTPITEGLDLYAAYYGYHAKGSSDSAYTLLPKSSSSVTRYKLNKTNTTESFSFSYALEGTATSKGPKIATDQLKGSSISVYKSYYATTIHDLVETKNKVDDESDDGYYKLYFNPNGTSGNRIHFARTFVFEIQNYDAHVYIHMFGPNDKETSWNGVQMTYLGYNGNKKFYMMDIDTSLVNGFTVNNFSYGQKDLAFPSGSDNCRWNYQYSDNGGWYYFGPESVIY